MRTRQSTPFFHFQAARASRDSKGPPGRLDGRDGTEMRALMEETETTEPTHGPEQRRLPDRTATSVRSLKWATQGREDPGVGTARTVIQAETASASAATAHLEDKDRVDRGTLYYVSTVNYRKSPNKLLNDCCQTSERCRRRRAREGGAYWRFYGM